MNRFQRFLVSGRVPLILAFLALAGGAAWLLRGFAVEAGTDVLLDQADTDRAYYNQTRADWGTDEYLIVCCHRNEGWFSAESLALLQELTSRLAAQPYVKSQLSIGTVPLLRNQPAQIFPVTLFDKENRLNPTVSV